MVTGFIRTLLARIFFWRNAAPNGKKPWPTREQIALLPWYDGLDLNAIEVVETEEAAQKANEDLHRHTVVGFDTESKPTFVKGEVSTGPHLAQFSTLEKCYVFPLHHAFNRKLVAAIMVAPGIKKVGFGLGDDLKRIRLKFHVQPHDVLDLETMFAERGYGRGVGVKTAVALVYKRRFRKSKSVSTSNWMNRRLSRQQILYAANDAYAPLKIYHTLLSSKRLPK